MDYSASDDMQLLELLWEENEEAFEELYKRYWKRIYSLAWTYLKSPEAAQDIVQDVFVKIWTGKKNLLHVRAFKPFLFVTARNLIVSNLRNKVFHTALNPDEQVEEETFLPDERLSYKQSLNLLYKAIELLPPQQQKVYRLSRNEGMHYEEIAQKMGISRLTVRTHMTKALSFIRKYLTDNIVHPVVLIIFLLWKNH